MKSLASNPGKRPLNLGQPRPRSEVQKCPSWLSTEAKREWRRATSELAGQGILTALDRGILALYCQTFASLRQREAVLAGRGRTYLTPSGQVRQWPEVAIAQAEKAMLRQLAADLGLTPTARARMGMPLPEGEEDEFSVS
ncbi:MAG: phage terminase small subunit P27 family [Chloroflexi bacterium]|nr:phage terminase small subunit P27 family [Chloroflexota bacterium]